MCIRDRIWGLIKFTENQTNKHFFGSVSLLHVTSTSNNRPKILTSKCNIIIQYPSARAASISLPDLHLPNELPISVHVACIILIIEELHVHTVLSTLLDNPGDSRFWTVSPSLRLDYSLKSLGWSAKLVISSVDLTFWQWNFNYFALFGLYYVNIERFLINFTVIQ